MQEGTSCLEKDAIDELVRMYLGRWDEEIEKLEKERRIGRPRSTQEDQLRLRKMCEMEETNHGGLDIPDMTDVANVSMLK